MTETEINKRVGIKFLGADRQTESLIIEPGTTARDMLVALKLDPVGFQLSDARNPDVVFRADDNVFARINDGDMLHAAASVIAGHIRVCKTGLGEEWAA